MTVRIDTAQAIEDLCAADVPEQQAKAIVRVMVQAQDGLVTKEYFDARLEAKFALQTAQLTGIAIAVAGLAVAVAKWVL
ncbi:MAG: hypothetical protein F4171_15660 [Gammaproteobacteria bacterium]|nr:hypothetical protein [Gammaproteobacteria bacterium]MYG14208.1 hypothetical protein [Gammaproteobacteria bacterium]MYK27228.1 hypothetical protein [Gammaproteobacteria bacterium]